MLMSDEEKLALADEIDQNTAPITDDIGLLAFARAIESRARADALEEAAKVCDDMIHADKAAAAIRALATGRK